MCCSVCTLKDFLVRFDYKNHCDRKHTFINNIPLQLYKNINEKFSNSVKNDINFNYIS